MKTNINTTNQLTLEEAKQQFEESIIRAREAGVPEEDILKTKEDIDDYFTKK